MFLNVGLDCGRNFSFRNITMSEARKLQIISLL